MSERLNAEQALAINTEIHVLTQGTSMRPLFKSHRDVVVIGRVTRELKRGDVPLYRNAREGKPYVLHRILKVKADEYIIRGDNTYKLEHVSRDRVVGVMTAFYRKGRYCDCQKSRGYRLYIFLNRISYPARLIAFRIWRRIRPINKNEGDGCA